MAKGSKTGGRRPGSVNKATAEVRKLARGFGPAAIERAARLAGLVLDDEGRPEGQAASEQAQLAALGIILDRAYGKAAQVQTGEDGDGPVKQVFEISWLNSEHRVPLARDDLDGEPRPTP